MFAFISQLQQPTYYHLVCPQNIDDPCDYNVTCGNDDDCDDEQWCCRSGMGCGYECVEPVASCAVRIQYN